MTSISGFFLDLSTVAWCLSPLLLLLVAEGLVRKPVPDWVFKLVIGLELFFVFAITIADPELYKQWGNKFNNQVLVYISHPREMAISTGAVQWGKTILFALI
jgi:hypothetical protein